MQTGSVSFIHTPSDSHLDWCVLYGNWTDGVWKYNSTDISPDNIAQNTFSITNIADGYYSWNVICVDSAGNNNTLTTNRTFGVDTQAPSLVLNYPSNVTTIGSDSINFSFNVSDTYGISSVNITINGTHNSSTSVVINDLTKISYINVTGFMNHQVNTAWYITAYDNSTNTNVSETRIFSINTSAPTIGFVSKTPEPSYPPSNVTINATIDSLFLAEIWIEGNWSGSWKNYTNTTNSFTINSTLKNYIYNISAGNFSNQQWVAYRWWANDTYGRTTNTSWYEFQVKNRAPTTAIWRYPIMNTHMLYNNFTMFNWDNSTDYDADEISYELEMYNSTAFNSTYFIFAFNSSISNYTLLIANMPPVGNYYMRYRANDSVGYNNYNYTNISVVYATLQIIAPTYDQILRRSNTYWFNVTELGNSDWVGNVSLEISGATFTNYLNLTANSTQFAYTSYGVSYTIPNVASQYVDIIAYSWNGTIGSSTNNSDTTRFRIKDGATTTPVINYFCPDNTYITEEQMNITVRSQMESVLIDEVNVSIKTPSGETIILNSTATNINNYIANSYAFEYNFTYTPPSQGEYELLVKIKDVNYDDSLIVVNKTSPLIVTNRTNIAFTSSGISNFTVKDICSNKAIVYSNSSLSMNEPPGVYNLEFKQDKLTVLLSNVTLDGDEGEICTYYDLAENIAAPTDTRAVDQFNLSCYNLDFGWSNNNVSVNMTYNYTNILGSITHEANLDAYKCDSTTACTWETVTSAVTSDLNKIEFAIVNFSVFMIAEDVTVTTVTVTAPGTGGGGGGGGGGTDQGVDLDILEPGALTVGDEFEFTTVVLVKNMWSQPLYGISLSAISDHEGLEFSFDKDYIFELPVGSQIPVTLTVKRLSDVDITDYDINVIANVASPNFVDKAKIAITSLGEGGPRAEAGRLIDFVDQLFVQNPACKELYELVKKSRESFEAEDYETSVRLSQGAVSACESLLTSLGLRIQKPRSKALSDNFILGIEIMVFLFVFYGLYYYYRRRRFKKKGLYR